MNFTLFFVVFIGILHGNAKPISKAPTFIYGVSGHPFNQEAYRNNINLQINLIKKINSEFYRIDIPTNDKGIMSDEKDYLELIIKLKKSGIKILPVIVFGQTPYSSENNTDAYNKGYLYGKNFTAKYKNYFKYYEIGNEEDNNIILSAEVHGNRIEHYHPDKSHLLMAYYKGICDAFKKGDSKAKIIINTGWVHYGFLQLLMINQVNYDIIGYHCYSEMGNIYEVRENFGNVIDTLYKKFHKRIWVTEFNIRKGTSLRRNYTAESWFIRNMNFLYNNKYVDAVFVYELFDQPVFNSKKSIYSNPDESNYGLASWVRALYTKIQEKPLFLIYKSFISKHP